MRYTDIANLESTVGLSEVDLLLHSNKETHSGRGQESRTHGSWWTGRNKHPSYALRPWPLCAAIPRQPQKNTVRPDNLPRHTCIMAPP
eukprot:7297364-Heterocapsa_arctica.AAC.1